jgi:hypothetical protein
MTLKDKAFKNIQKQVRRGKAVPDAEGNPDVMKMFNEWSVGFQQHLTGKAMTRFVEEFLGLFPTETRKTIEDDIKSLHGVSSFPRFRKKVLVSFATAFQNGVVAQKGGKDIDILQMVKNAVKETEKSEGFSRSVSV